MYINDLDEKEGYKRQLLAEIRKTIDPVSPLVEEQVVIIVTRNIEECERLLQEYCEFFDGGMLGELSNNTISLIFSDNDEAMAFCELLAN